MKLPILKKHQTDRHLLSTIGAVSHCLLLLAFFGCANEGQAPATTQTQTTDTTSMANQTQPEAYTSATSSADTSFVIRDMACGKKVKIKENGLEAKLLAQIEDKATEPAKMSTLVFDEVVFENGTSKLDMAKSARQLSNIAQIMTCYPNTKVSIGVNGAADQKNLTMLDREIITVVKATLIGLGVTPAKLQSETTGQGGNAAQPAARVSLKLLAK